MHNIGIVLLAILVCPKIRGSLRHISGGAFLFQRGKEELAIRLTVSRSTQGPWLGKVVAIFQQRGRVIGRFLIQYIKIHDIFQIQPVVLVTICGLMRPPYVPFPQRGPLLCGRLLI